MVAVLNGWQKEQEDGGSGGENYLLDMVRIYYHRYQVATTVNGSIDPRCHYLRHNDYDERTSYTCTTHRYYQKGSCVKLALVAISEIDIIIRLGAVEIHTATSHTQQPYYWLNGFSVFATTCHFSLSLSLLWRELFNFLTASPHEHITNSCNFPIVWVK